MEYKDPEFELLSSLEQIIFKDVPQTITLQQKSNPFTEYEQLRKGTGLKTEEFARAMGVSVAMVLEWESKRETHPNRVKADAPDSGQPCTQQTDSVVKIECPAFAGLVF
jgi:putative transcriptional regulator